MIKKAGFTTDTQVHRLNPLPGQKQTEYFHDHVRGLIFRAGLKKRCWVVKYTLHGKRKKYTLAEQYPDIGVAAAVQECMRIRAEAKKGIDPQGNKACHELQPTMIDLWNTYQDSLTSKTKQKSLGTMKEEQRRWEKIINPTMGAMKVANVAPKDLSSMLNKVAKTAPVSANRFHSLLQVMFKPALAQGWITIHPLQWIDPPGGKESPRQRVLTDEEIKILWHHFDQLRPNPRDALKIGLYTAQRPGAILAMEWKDIDLEKGQWKQVHNKTDAVHIIPLSPQVRNIILARVDNNSKWVFPSKYNSTRIGAMGDGRYKSTKDARYKLHKESGIKDWTTHDLRRTAHALMSRLEIPHHIRARVLNHSQEGNAPYTPHDYLSEKTVALEMLTNEIDRLCMIDS